MNRPQNVPVIVRHPDLGRGSSSYFFPVDERGHVERFACNCIKRFVETVDFRRTWKEGGDGFVARGRNSERGLAHARDANGLSARRASV